MVFHHRVMRKKRRKRSHCFCSIYLLYNSSIADFLVPGEASVVQQSKRKFSRGMLNFGTLHRIICQEIHVNTVFLCPDLVTTCVKWIVSEVST